MQDRRFSGWLEVGKAWFSLRGLGYFRRISLRQPVQRIWPESILVITSPVIGSPQDSHIVIGCESAEELAGSSWVELLLATLALCALLTDWLVLRPKRVATTETSSSRGAA